MSNYNRLDMLQEIMEEKLGVSLFSLVSALLLGEVGFFALFPADIFKAEAFLYPIISQAFISLFAYYKALVSFKPEVEGKRKLDRKAVGKLLMTLAMAALSNFIFVALLLSYAKSNTEGLFVSTINLLNKKETLIFFSLMVGLFFEYLAGDENIGFLRGQLKNIYQSFIKNQSKKISNDTGNDSN